MNEHFSETSFAAGSAVYRRYRYTSGSKAIHQGLTGRAFFPGGSGTVSGLNEPPKGGIVFLGHNFDSYDGYQKSMITPEAPEGGVTWKHIDDDYLCVLPSEKIFFTNYFLGARTEWRVVKSNGQQSNQGTFPADAGTKADANDFLVETIKRIEPVIVVVLGGQIPGYVVPEWRNRSLKSLQTEAPVKRHGSLFISVYHPSARITCERKAIDAKRIADLFYKHA